MSEKKIGVIIGSLRKESYSRKLAEAIIKIFPDGHATEIVEIGDLPLYNQDFDDDGNLPDSYGVFREKIKDMDAYLFVTPEHNRSMPAAMKNALDVGSRPYGANAWGGKPGAVVSAAPGKIGGFGANHHLRQSLVFLDICTLQQPEMYVGGVDALMDDAGNITSDGTGKFLQGFVDAFVAWIKRFS